MELKLTADKKLLEALHLLADALKTGTAAAPATPQPVRDKDMDNRESKRVAPKTAAEEQKPVDRADVRALAVRKIQAGLREQVEALLEKYDAESITLLAEEHLTAFMADLQEVKK